MIVSVLGDFFELQRGTTYKSALLGQPGPVLLGLGSIARNGGFKGDNLKTYGGPCDPRHLLTPGEIYVSLKDVTQSADLLGAVARLPARVPLGRLTQDTVKLVFKAEDAPRTYLYWLLQTPQSREYCRAHSTGTTNLGLARDDFLNFEVPPLTPERQWIVDLVQSIEDKIELNRRMNETLEGMAQAIFRDWFVDFGPVRRALAGAADPVAIMGGLTPNPARAAHLAALFPAAFGNDGLPVGWSERPLDTIAEFLNGLALQKHPAKPGEPDLPVIKIAELRNGLTERSNRAARTLPAKYIIKDGDFIFSWSGSLMAKVWTEGEGALNQHLFKVSSDAYPQWFYGLWVHHHMPEFQLIAASKATTMGHIQRMHLSNAATVCPPDPTIQAMSAVMQPLWDRMIHNELENRTLAETRDYLLPRLMSGAVRVTPQAEAA